MRLWTIQPVEVVNILERDGVFTCDPEKSEYYNAFYDAYLWIAAEMDKRNIPHPDGIKLPLWAWHTRDWKHKKPDLRTTGLQIPFSALYDIRQYDKRMNGCYMEIKKI